MRLIRYNAQGQVISDEANGLPDPVWSGSLRDLYVTPEMFGAKADWRQVLDAAMTAGSATLTSASAAFTAADVGKYVSVQGAGSAPGSELVTTITGYTNGTTVTLAAAATATVTASALDIATDDTVALQAAIDACFPDGGVVRLAQKVYVVMGTPRTDRGCRAILCPPDLPGNDKLNGGPALTIEGVLPPENYMVRQGGRITAIRTFRNSDTWPNDSGGGPAVIGASGNWNVTLRNLAVMVPRDPRISGIDFFNVLRCELDAVYAFPEWRGFQPNTPNTCTAYWPYGIRMPKIGNYHKSLMKTFMAGGFWTGILANAEHTVGLDVISHRNRIGVAWEPALHASVWLKLGIEVCNKIFAAWDPNGTATQPGYGAFTAPNGMYPLTITQLDIETASGMKIYDPHSKLRGIINFFNYNNTRGDPSSMIEAGGAGLKLTNIMNTGNGTVVISDTTVYIVDGVLNGTNKPTLTTAAGTGFNGALVFDGSGVGSAGGVCAVDLGLPVAQIQQYWAPVSTQPWSIECRFKRARTGVAEVLLSEWATTGGGGPFDLSITAADVLQFVMRGAGSTNYIVTGATAITDTNWHTVEMSYDGTTLRGFLDGALQGSIAAVWATSPRTDLKMFAGARPSGEMPFAGSINEVRLSKIARHTAAYTPPVLPYGSDFDTAGLWHFDRLF